MVDLKKVYEEEHVHNDHVQKVLPFSDWKSKYNAFQKLEKCLESKAKKGQFDMFFEKFDRRGQELARELGY